MDSEYDRKFEEMKKYIPFLESMITRLETTKMCSNPRQAQLNKIRSLRDLLMDKKKRMKMENLLKCEQVLVNLYAKVEQRDAIPELTNDSAKTEKNDLNVVRTKLKSVVSKLHHDVEETLPEIARASETEEVCVPGSKEPALFQRRPNVASIMPLRLSPSKSKESTSKRNYTRVLLSPERRENHWPNEVPSSEKPLFSRRSPKKSPRKRSPSYHRKERKKSTKNKSKYNESKDLNITLNVPEDSLNSLNTKDILSRIINCSDSDVDIATLRELRTQILGELKETGANDDISDIILKSYKKKTNKQKKGKRSKNIEVEEGELSDSESEAIKSIYGSLVVMDKNKSVCVGTKSSDKEKPRKIQICLVINSDKTKPSTQEDTDGLSCVDSSDFETFNNEKNNDESVSQQISTNEQNYDDKAKESLPSKDTVEFETDSEKLDSKKDAQKICEKIAVSPKDEENQNDDENESLKAVKVVKTKYCKPDVEGNHDEQKNESNDKLDDGLPSDFLSKDNIAVECKTEDNSEIKVNTDIPLLEPTKQVSEIDILQALKKEILSETTSALNTDSSVSKLDTPPLHQPKITKVANAQEIGSKKRISIESYKAKAITPSISRLSNDTRNSTVKEDISRKQSLKLTEKECERFNFLSKLTLTESSEDEDNSNMSLDDIYTNLAPKSPDHEDFADTGLKPPIIIPSDPVQTTGVGSEADVDMRKILPNAKSNDPATKPILSPPSVEKSIGLNSDQEVNKINERVSMHLIDPRMKRDINSGLSQDNSASSQLLNIENTQRPIPNFVSSPAMHNISVDLKPALNVISNTNRHSVMTPSLQNLNMTPNMTLSMSPNIIQSVATPNMACPLIPSMTPNRTSNITPNIPLCVTPNIPLLMTPSRTPNVANMTPSRTPNIAANMTPNMTPSRHTFDIDDYSNHKHVYAPMFSAFEPRDGMIENSRENHQMQWDTSDSRSSFREDRNPRNNSMQRDIDYRETRNSVVANDVDYRDQMSNSAQRDIDYRNPRSHSVQRDIDYRNNQSNHGFDKRDSDRLQFPTTSNHQFGRLDCPPTPTSSFGMLEMPMTPVHPFGRSDCPLTPSHPFGRSESLLPTPHSFLRSEYNSQSISRSQDPRLNRSSDYDGSQYRDDDRDRTYFQEGNFNSGSYNADQSNRHNHSEFRKYHRGQSVGRNERNKNYETVGRNYRDQMSRRETSVGHCFNREDISRSYNRDNEGDRFSRNRSHCGRSFDYRNHNDAKKYDESGRRDCRRERSVGRTQETISSSFKDCKSSKFSEENKLCIRPYGGHSFTIDTSINRTFQESNTRRKPSSSFDVRRQRASSVGRTLLSDTRTSKTSTNEAKQMLNDNQRKNNNVRNFQRASSVGREVQDCKLDFKDIKAELKSFKVKSDLSFSKGSFNQDLCKSPIEYPKTFNRGGKKTGETRDKSSFDLKYSPRKNNRDPRMRREYTHDTKDRNKSKNYGIVYSNDNISKGTILGLGYGVKNYKIPKLKRPQQTVDTSKSLTTCKPDIGEENMPCSKNIPLDLKQKDIKTDFENGDNKKELEEPCTKQNSKKDDYKEIEKNECETIKNCQSKSLEIARNKDIKQFPTDDSNTNEGTKIENADTISDNSLDTIERRVTRSTRRSMTEEPKLLEMSPVKRTRKPRKTLVLESDSDDNDKLTKLKSFNSEELAPKVLTSTGKTEVLIEQSTSVVDTGENPKASDTQCNLLNETFLDLSKQKTNVECVLTENTKTETLELDTTKQQVSDSSSNILVENDKQNEDDLDSSFGIGDLDVFSDNIASDPVIDSINALIADLDHDLDSSKSTDTNSHFTKELSLETMLENLSSPDKTDKKDTLNVSSHEQEGSDKNNSEEVLNMEKIVIYPEDQRESNDVQYTDNSVILKMDDCINYDKSQINESKTNIPESGGSELLTSISNINSISHTSEIGLNILEKKEECFQTHVQPIEINKVNVEDSCSNDAIVSTSDDGNISKQETGLKNYTDNEIANSPSTPDSTINSNENIEDADTKIMLPLAKESGSEMNSDITSTHVTETGNEESLEILSTDAGTSSQIESIGKLLSILQDKSKIKELLSMLGDRTFENEKIKKKLEKLSEIVSDDESTIESNVTENLENNKNILKDNSDENVIVEQEELNKPNLNSKSQNEQEENLVNIVQNKILNDKETKEKEVDEISKNICYEEYSNLATIAVNEEAEINDICNKDEPIGEFQEDLQENIIEEKKSLELDETNFEDSNNYDKQQNLTAVDEKPTAKKMVKKKCRKGKKRNNNQRSIEDKRLTRSDAVNLKEISYIANKPLAKKPSRELQKLQEDIREMFLKDDILNATGIRMCRIAKLVDEKKSKDELSSNDSNQAPSAVLKKCSNFVTPEPMVGTERVQKKKISKSKIKVTDINTSIDSANKTVSVNLNKTEPVLVRDFKTKLQEKQTNVDPYDFESDSVSDLNNLSDNKNDSSSGSESDSVASTKSFESTELSELKKKVKRKRGKGWKAGVIKPKNRKKKLDQTSLPNTPIGDVSELQTCKTPDFTCFTDRTYCFRKNVSCYNCRICSYSGIDIVHHYKKEHPHTEVPLSRMNPIAAKEAIKESEHVNFQGISKMSSKKYVCRFCFKEFSRKKRLLESFFWHIVSMHTGEYKHTCTKCVDTQSCPLDIDIPPPPTDEKGQLLGYICEKCNYTQISLENLKTHVIVWHNDEQTAVYTVNLAVLSKQAVNSLLKPCDAIDMEEPRVLRSSRSNQSMAEASDGESDTTEEINESIASNDKADEKGDQPVVEKTLNIQSKITFESDTTDDILNLGTDNSTIKSEPDANENQDCHDKDAQSEPEKVPDEIANSLNTEESEPNESNVSENIFDYPHFKIKYNKLGIKEYVCCINSKNYHYSTSLLISMKKHVQLRHSEKWDGYCCLCKVIVTPQGQHKFKDCWQHYLDKHLDNFPTVENDASKRTPETNEPVVTDDAPDKVLANKSYINVRPLSELISKPTDSLPLVDNSPVLPVIESVISLGDKIDQSRPSPSYPAPIKEKVEVAQQHKYEEFQADIMSRKHRVVLEAMMSHIKLAKVYKCAGRFCSFTTDSAEDALLHASTHMRIGGIDSLNCVYCDYDSFGNAIDLITHVFKYHGCCPYVCGLCFYRAAASQLVNAHIKRVHDNAKNVAILKTPFQTTPFNEDNILSRDVAVPYYLCSDKSAPDGPCKFRTYTPGKFCEHLQTRHSSATEHLCFICSTSLPTAAELIRHLKLHGLKLYQCTWCVFGADNETELLEHASALHPARQPKAYLRIITNKEGTSEYRVLPLAHLNKSDVPAIDVAPSNQKDFPVREAERSMELEKLIGHTTLMIESMTTSAEADAGEADKNAQIESAIQSEASLLQSISILKNSETEIPRVSTPPPTVTTIDQSDNDMTPIIKVESLDITPEKIPQQVPEIVCLDSDDEVPNQIAPNVSEVGVTTRSVKVIPPPALKKVRLTELFMCSKCKMIMKCGSGFKKHINACYAFTSDPIPCAHCILSITKKNIVTHYNTHCDKSKESLRFFCQKCSLGFSSITQAKEHQLVIHNISTSEGPSLPNFIKEVPPPPKGRRKRSLETVKDKAVQPPAKVKRYGPLDIDKLPINPILDDSVVCSLCEFNTKVRLNMVRHLQLHAQQQPVPQTAPVNPVPHLETNEKHFDKMLNLASSSIATRLTDRSNKADSGSAVVISVPPETVSRYPKYIPDKQRLTCGAKGCSYISVDETMLKCHWETLHHDTNDFHCVHCPPYQQLDKSKPVTASRIIAHLKMHDEKLYACALCSYYHFRRPILEKHLAEVHKGGQVMIVRESKVSESIPSTSASASQIRTPAPTMDLKPWQCGLCKYKSLLRPEVVEHCAKTHNSKMQFRCAYCAFRTSNQENITKHQAKSHADKAEEIFYYYYREGSVTDEPDGTTRWQKQSQSIVPSETKVKSENPSDVPCPSSLQKILPPRKPITVDLNLVKKENIEPIPETIEGLCKEFGEFCEPNGLKYKCSLCSNVIEDTSEAMQSHLYEELKYRKWGCSICSYKAFHKEGLNEHMQTEHRQNRDPIALPVDNRVETWVTKLLEYQTALIGKYKENLAKQKVEILRVNPGPSVSKPQPQQAKESITINPSLSSPNKPDLPELEKIFGPCGASVNLSFCCPKCNSLFKEEAVMHSHLESELNKIRWFCSNCCLNFQTYHEAQFHSRSVHIGQGARPVEVTRDTTIRLAWVEAVIRVQKSTMNLPTQQSVSVETPPNLVEDFFEPENSLLVVRYEEKIPTPEEVMARGTPAAAVDSDDEKLVIDEPLEKRRAKPSRTCPHCVYVSTSEKVLHDHILRHYCLKAFTCPYCNLNGFRKAIEKHQKMAHPMMPINLAHTTVPSEPPTEYLKKFSSSPNDGANTVKFVCLVCRNYFTEAERQTHVHDKVLTTFGRKGEVVVQCSVCFTLHKDVTAYLRHHKLVHPELGINYVFSKLNTISVEAKELLYACSCCSQKFSHMKDIKLHADSNHQSVLKYTLVPKHNIPIIDLDEYEEPREVGKRKNDDDSILPPCKRTARKSTTKLPDLRQFARKSTTKLPFDAPEFEEFSYYGRRPSNEDLEGSVVTMMPFCNKMVPFTLNRLREIINIDPVVIVDKMIIE